MNLKKTLPKNETERFFNRVFKLRITCLQQEFVSKPAKTNILLTKPQLCKLKFNFPKQGLGKEKGFETSSAGRVGFINYLIFKQFMHLLKYFRFTSIFSIYVRYFCRELRLENFVQDKKREEIVGEICS